MALTSPVEQFYIKTLPGMNIKREDLELEQQFVELAQNARFENEPGTVDKRDPTSFYNTTSLGSGAIMGLKRFYRSDGTIKSICVHSTHIYVGTDATGAFTALTLPAGMTLTENKRMCFTVYKDLLIMGNGADNIMVYDGSANNVIWELGSCKAVVGTGTGITRTLISYQVTFGDAVLGDDYYVCGAVSNEIATVSNKDIELSNIPIGPSGVTNRKIYRKSSETGGAYKLVATIANNSATTYTDNTADASGAAAIPAVTDDFPKGNMLQVYRERLFICGNPNSPNTIYYSNPYAPWYIQATTNLDYMEIDPADGDEIMGVPIVLGTMSVFKRNTVRKVHVSNATGSWDANGGFSLSSGGPDSWYSEDPIAFTGAVAQWSIVQTQVGVLFLGWDHWYQFNGAQVTPIIDEFDVADILSSSYSDVVAHFTKGNLLWAYAKADLGNSYHDTVGRYNFFRNALSLDVFTRYDSTSRATEKTGINCFASYDGDDESGDVYYGDSKNGFVYRAEDTPQWIRWNKKSQLSESTVDDIYIGGEEDNAWFEVGWDVTIDELTQANVTPTAAETAWVTATVYHVGAVVLSGGSEYVCSAHHTSSAATEPGVGVSWATVWGLDVTALSIDKLPGVIDRNDTTGTITFNSMQINAGSLINLYWNMRKYHDSDTVKFYIRTGATQGTCEAAAWVPAAGWAATPADMSAETANVWLQMKAVLTCNSISGSPVVYYSDGYIIKFNYRIGGSIAENAVEFIYDTGWRHFDAPFVDKIFKKILAWYEGTEGSLLIEWETENSSGTFTIDLTLKPSRWESFFPSTAIGRKISLRVYKNDLSDVKIREMKGLYTPEPILI